MGLPGAARRLGGAGAASRVVGLYLSPRRRRGARYCPQTPGARYSVYALVHGLIQHNLYHAGQISLLKKMLS